ncbi:MAG: class I SAM-dependent methyltransferase [Planctomycetaceae bacterium]|nr:class I SAM-dependent methyltransferase [Planctomycetaceae bacterium]
MSLVHPWCVLEMVPLVRALNIAVELDIADRLHKKKMRVEELAAETGVLAEPLHRVLRALAAQGYFREEKNRVFVNTKKSSKYLRSDTEGSVKDWILYVTGEEAACSQLQSLNVVKTGQSGSQILFGKRIYDVLYNEPGHEKALRAFVRGQGKFTEWQSRLVAKSYNFKSVNKIVDVAGGHGYLISRILQANPHLKGAMVDLPVSIERAKNTVIDSGVSDRCELIAGDMFDADTLPKDGDLYTIKNVLWDWDDANALKILQNIRKVILSHAKLMIIENSLSTDNDTDGLAKLYDLDLMFRLYGKSRTWEEWLELTRSAGFSLERIRPTSQFGLKLMIFRPVP